MEKIELENVDLKEIDMNDDLLAANNVNDENTQEFNLNFDTEKTQELEMVNHNE